MKKTFKILNLKKVTLIIYNINITVVPSGTDWSA